MFKDVYGDSAFDGIRRFRKKYKRGCPLYPFGFVSTINSADFFGCPKHTVLCLPANAKRVRKWVFWEQWLVTYEFGVRNRSFDEVVPTSKGGHDMVSFYGENDFSKLGLTEKDEI